ncbi:techylectin-like protein [Stegodyphus dumicola]|uniref:techylectin-like protein n=1 Tax=Stegodyphus dumicola TaxID=202533 RepID=UPI0015AF29AB|nr:techylectin-like protein [Stegodyphus dumicola]
MKMYAINTGILFALFWVLSVAKDDLINLTECGLKAKSISYLDLALESIHNAKENYPACTDSTKPQDCEDLLNEGYNASGVYRIWPRSRVMEGKSLKVFCDMDTDGGGWTIIQRRGNFLRPKDYFYQDWDSYKKGFGNIERDFWLGNDNIFALSSQKIYSLRIDLTDVEGNTSYALYDEFWIDDEAHNYTLHVNGYSGDAGDSLHLAHNNHQFSTKDRDNDGLINNTCAQLYKGGWWYNACHASNLNGLYLRGKHESYVDGVVWYTWKGDHESMDTVEMKLRSKDFTSSPISSDFITTQ